MSTDVRSDGARCPSDDELLALVCGTTNAATRLRLLRHAEPCQACALIIAEAGLALDEAEPPAAPRLEGRPSAVFEPGQLVASRYRIARRLGRGGMGEVYAAYDQELGEDVALKTIALALAEEPSAVQRLKLELRLARSVTHPHVGRVFELGRHERPDGGSQWFFTLQLIAGQSLRRYLAENGPPPLAEAVVWAEQLARGLAAIHAQNVVHRDIKPENVMLSPVETPSDALWVDFGLARVDLSDTRSPGLLRGTPGYAAPELAQGAVASRHSDIYAFGVLLHELVYGARPWSSVISVERPGLPAPLRALLTQCLEKTPERRPRSADEVAERIRALSRAAPRRRPAAWPWLALALTLAGALIALIAFSGESEDPLAPVEHAVGAQTDQVAAPAALASTPATPRRTTDAASRSSARRAPLSPTPPEPSAAPGETVVPDFGGRR